MARYCPRACGRLATAAIFISVGIVQIIAGIILLKSEYAYMLFGPNIWTALSNITVGVLLGVASTVWKTINKNSSRHASRRKLLEALVGSVFILNATTAAMLIIGEGNSHLAIHLERGGVRSTKTLEMEILAYAYATSVCSPIVCVVVSIAFLTGICFRQKSQTIKTLDFKNVLNEDDAQMYDWVYTSNLPKPNPEILKTAISSESESSSSESESDSSSYLPVPIHLRSRASLSDIKNSLHGSLRNSSLQFSANRNRSFDNSVPSDLGKTRSIPRLNRSSLIETPVHIYDDSLNSCRSGTPASGRRTTPAMVAFRSDTKPGTPIRVGASNVFEKSACSPNFQFNSVLFSDPKSKLSFSSMNQGTTPRRLQMAKKAKCLVMDLPSTSLQSFVEDSTDFEDPASKVPDLLPKTNTCSPNPNPKICRTSTTDQTKVHQELENLDNSAIHFDSGVTAFKEIYLDETLPGIKNKGRISSSSLLGESTIEEGNASLRSSGDMSIYVRNSNFRKKLSSKLVPASGPVISDNHNFYKTSNRKSTRSGRMKPYSKSKNGHDKYLQTGFSSFRDSGQVDEVDAMVHSKKYYSNASQSPLTSISDKPSEEETDSFMPSTSTSTSGYMSASYEESGDETDLKPNLSTISSRQRQPSSAQKLIADEIRERYQKRSERVSFESDNGSFHQVNKNNAKQLKVESQIAVPKDVVRLHEQSVV